MEAWGRLAELPRELGEASTRLRLLIGQPAEGSEPANTFLLESGQCPPLLRWPEGMARDLALAPGEALERALFLSGLYAASATLLEEMLLDRAPGRGPEDAMLARLLEAWSIGELAALPGSESVVTAALRHRAEQAIATLDFHRAHAGRVSVFTDAEIGSEGRRWAIARTGPVALLLACGRGALVPDVEPLLEELCALHLLRSELLGLPRDLERGHVTRPIVAILESIGASGTPVPERVLGAALLSDAVPQLATEGSRRAGAAAAKARELGLPSLGDDAEALARAFGEVLEMFTAQKALRLLARLAASPPSSAAEMPPADPRGPRIERASKMAEALLLDDPTLRECWEVHRWGMVRAPLLTGRALPGALLLENLGAAGAPVGELPDRFFEIFEANGFRMYDEPNPLPPDLDTLGVYLRLRRYTVKPAHWTARLAPFLAAADAATPDSGDTPIWLGAAPDTARRGSEDNAIIGAHCLTCHAGYLAGLLDPALPRAESSDAIGRLRRHVVGAIASGGTAGAAYYTSLYSAWIMARLIRVLEAEGEDTGAARATIERLLEREGRWSRLSPQDAALLLLARRELGGEPEPAWLDAILAGQMHDGGWAPEPYYLTAQPWGTSGWHRSRLLTSSLCFRALSVHTGRNQG